jgi:hypothetical protein
LLSGDDHRLLVVNGELVAATRRTPGHVVGDGVHTVAQLVDIVNQDPRRGVGHEKVMTRIELDAQADMMLHAPGPRPTACRPRARWWLRSTANLSTGGTATDVTDIIHPDNREMAVRAVTAIGLDVGGVDFLTPTSPRATRPRRRRRHLRGERRAGLPHARGAQRRHAARRRRPGDRHAVPARRAVARADRRHHRHQRQDHHQRACWRTSPRWPATRRA